MRVVNNKDGEWFLFENEGRLLLEANCNHSFIGYLYTIELNEEELQKYKEEGHEYLSKLAQDIHNSVPIIKDSKSKYVGRDVSDTYAQQTLKAVQEWRSKNDHATT